MSMCASANEEFLPWRNYIKLAGGLWSDPYWSARFRQPTSDAITGFSEVAFSCRPIAQHLIPPAQTRFRDGVFGDINVICQFGHRYSGRCKNTQKRAGLVPKKRRFIRHWILSYPRRLVISFCRAGIILRFNRDIPGSQARKVSRPSRGLIRPVVFSSAVYRHPLDWDVRHAGSRSHGKSQDKCRRTGSNAY